MAHRTSAPALRAARVVLKSYSLTVKPPQALPSGRLEKLEADERCVAILIDYATNIFKIAELRPELRYWQKRIFDGSATAPGIATYFKRVLEAFSYLPKEDVQKSTVTLETPTTFKNTMVPKEFGGRTFTHTLSKMSLEASRFIFYYYYVQALRERFGDNESVHRNNVAKLIDVTLETHRMLKALPMLEHWYNKLKAGEATAEEIKTCLRDVGIFFAFMPNYGNPEEELKLL